MTQIISIRTPDGIVIAGDSLATLNSPVTLEASIDFKCSCGKKSNITKPISSGVALPRSTFSFAQKVFPFLDQYGIGAAGSGQLCDKTTYFAIRELEDYLREKKKKKKWSLQEAAEEIKKYFHLLVKKQFPDLSSSDDDWNGISFQIVGYEDATAKSLTIYIGKKVRVDNFNGMGATFIGDQKISQTFMELYGKHRDDKPRIELFSLQDAVDYAEFMINTTASYQRFSSAMPSVGGNVDIALVTPFDGFKWIKQKHMGNILGGLS